MTTGNTMRAQAPLDELVHIEDRAWYLDDPWPIYARLRREAPVYFIADIVPGEPFDWVQNVASRLPMPTACELTPEQGSPLPACSG